MCIIDVGLPISVARVLTPRIEELAKGMKTQAWRVQQQEQAPLSSDFAKVPEWITTHQLSIIERRDEIIASGNYECLKDRLPAMRSDLDLLGFDEPTGYMKPICIVPIVMIHSREVKDPPTSWADLLDERWKGRITTSAPDILVKLLTFYANALFGENAERLVANIVFDGIPIDTNLHVDNGEADVGIIPLPFARASRKGNVFMRWPEEGALSIPHVVIHKKGSFEDTRALSEFLLSEDVQRYMSETGMLMPVHPGVPLPPEVEQNNLNLYWKGWDWFLEGLGHGLATAHVKKGIS